MSDYPKVTGEGASGKGNFTEGPPIRRYMNKNSPHMKAPLGKAITGNPSFGEPIPPDYGPVYEGDDDDVGGGGGGNPAVVPHPEGQGDSTGLPMGLAQEAARSLLIEGKQPTHGDIVKRAQELQSIGSGQKYQGGGGSGKFKSSTGLDIGKQLSFLPEEIRPPSDAYLAPDYLDKLETAMQNGAISEEDFGKALDIVDNYYNKTVMGTQVGAQRGEFGLQKQQGLNEVENMKLAADARLGMANKQLELVDRLENSDILFQAAERKKKKSLDGQIALMRNKIARIEEGGNAQAGLGPVWGAVMAVIGASLSTASAVASGQPHQGGQQLMRQIGMAAAMQQQGSGTSDLRAGLQGEFNIYQLMRQGIQDDQVAFAATKASMIRRVKLEIEGMGMKSASELTRQKATQLVGYLNQAEAVEEKKMLAAMTMKAEQEKSEWLGRARGGVSKVKKSATTLTQTNGMPYSEPQKGELYFQFEGANGDMYGGFGDEKRVRQWEEINSHFSVMENSLNTLEELHRNGSYLSSADRWREQEARNRGMDASRGLTKMGALDKGAQEVAGAFIPEVLGPLTNMPIFGGEAGKKLRYARQRFNQMKQQQLNNIQQNSRAGREQMIVDPETGEGRKVNVYFGENPGRTSQQAKAGGRAKGLQNTQDSKFGMGPVQ